MNERITGSDIRLAIAAWHTQRGMVAPDLTLQQVQSTADRLAAVLHATEPPRQLPASPIDSPTTVLETVTRRPAPAWRGWS